MHKSARMTMLESKASQFAEAVFAAMRPEPEDRLQNWIADLIDTLIRGEAWHDFDVFYVTAMHAADAADINWKYPERFRLVKVGGGATFTAFKGYQGNGTSTAMSCGYVPSTNGLKYQQDNASLMVWANLNQQDTNPICGRVAALGYHLGTRNGSNAMGGRLNDNDTTTRANSDARGLSMVSRSAAGTKKYFRAGVQVGADVSVASTGVPTVGSWVAGGGANASWEDQQIAAYALGSGQAGREALINDALTTFMTRIGNV